MRTRLPGRRDAFPDHEYGLDNELGPVTQDLQPADGNEPPSPLLGSLSLATELYTIVRLALEVSAPSLLVPTEAVIATGARTVVIVDQGNGMFGPVDVELGREGNGQTEIHKGLTAGQKVVVSGQFLIDSEASLTGALGRLGNGPAKPAPNPGGPDMEHRP